MFNPIVYSEVCKIFIESNQEVIGLVYYSHIPTALLAVLFGGFVFFKSGKILLGRLLFWLGFLFLAWSFLDVLCWTSADTRVIMFSWSLLGFLYTLIFVVMLYFIYVFFDKKDISFWKKLLLFSPVVPVMVLTGSRWNLSGFNYSECEAIEGKVFIECYHLFGLFIIIWILFLTIHRYRRETERSEKNQIALVGIGSDLFLFSFFLAGYIASLSDEFLWGIYGLFGMPVFLGFLVLLIVRYKAFNIRMFGAQALVFTLLILIGSQFFFIRTTTNQILTGATLFFCFIFGYFLIRSVRAEIEQKEELQKMADRLAQSNRRLKELDQAKSDFISIASHQLRTPLTSVKGFISLILEGSYGDVTGEIRTALNKVYLSNERLIHLVEDLLNISRIESGKLQFRVEVCDIGAVVREVVDMFQLRAQEKEMRVVLSLPKDGLPSIMTDEQKIREILSNIIDNAIKYSEAGTVKVSMAHKDNRVRISVKDRGVGIDPADIPFLFQKFSRGKDIGRLHANGTGLGLYVGKNLIEALNGSISVESEGPGKGATFTIDLPVTSFTKGLPKVGEKKVF